MDLEQLFDKYKEQSLKGRYITLSDIEPLLNRLSVKNEVKVVGKSVLEKPIYQCKIGTGKIKILLWSQMHGNESTTTKALFDFLNLLNCDTDLAKTLLNNYTFCCLPMLNPDGAALYTRENANKVDLNRDAQLLSQPESKVLRSVFTDFKPDYCYNLHDQRSIFGTEQGDLPATVSFLAPSYNEACDINETRLKAIDVIVSINNVLQELIPGQIGRFDDAFNINCIGDTFQSLGVPTILFEAGHFVRDYEREETRKYVFIAFVAAFSKSLENVLEDNNLDKYISIPQNKIKFYDFIYRNVALRSEKNTIITNFAVHYKEELVQDVLHFIAYIVEVGDLLDRKGHLEYDAQEMILNIENVELFLMQKADFTIGDNVNFSKGVLKN
jgi:hypothetical protein